MTHPDGGPAPWDEKQRPDPASTTTPTSPTDNPDQDMADDEGIEPAPLPAHDAEGPQRRSAHSERVEPTNVSKKEMEVNVAEATAQHPDARTSRWARDDDSAMARFIDRMLELRRVLYKYAKFVGPGMMVAVAYIDPGKRSCNANRVARSDEFQEIMRLTLRPVRRFASSCCSSSSCPTFLPSFSNPSLSSSVLSRA